MAPLALLSSLPPSFPPFLPIHPFIHSVLGTSCGQARGWAPGGWGEAWGEGNQSSCKSCPQGATAGKGGQTVIGCFLSYFGALGAEGGKAAL